MKPCPSHTKLKRKRSTRTNGRKSQAAGAIARPGNSPTPEADGDSASWRRIAAAVERSNRDLMIRLALMTRSLQRLKARLAHREARHG